LKKPFDWKERLGKRRIVRFSSNRLVGEAISPKERKNETTKVSFKNSKTF